MIAPVLATGLGVLLPLSYLAIRVLDADQGDVLRQVLLRPRNLQLLANTLLLSAAVLGLVTLLAIPLAWLTTHCRLAGGRLTTIPLVMPLAAPGYLTAYAYLSASGDYGAVWRLFGLRLPLISGFWGAALALTCYNLPYMFLNLRVGFQRLNPNLAEAARSLGERPGGIFFRVVLPQLKPSLLAGALLVILHVLGDFGVVSLMHYETFSYAIYQEYHIFYNRTNAAGLALPLLAVTGVLLIVDACFLRRLRLELPGPGAVRRRRLKPLGCWAAPAYGFILAVFFVSVALPIGVMIYWLGQAGALRGASNLGEALWGSISVSLPAALLATALATPVAYLSRRYPSFLSAALERWAYLGYATPPLAFGLALIFFSVRLLPPQYQPHQWLGFLVLACALHYLAEAVGPIRSCLFKASKRLEEAARSLGERPWTSFCRVTLPLIRNGLVVSAAFVFLSTMKELPLTFLLSPFGFETLSANVWNRMEAARYAEAAPFALTIVASSVLFVGLLLLQDEKSR